MVRNISVRTRSLVQLAILTAIIIIMWFTPLGFLNIGSISITFIAIPVAIGAITMGPLAGGILGLVFGVASLAKAYMGDPFGTLLLGLNPFLTIILCIVPRFLMGLLTGYLFKLLKNLFKSKSIIAYSLSTFGAAILNTILFVSALGLLFIPYAGDLYETTFWAFFVSLILLNAVVESLVALVVGGAICQALVKFQKKANISDKL